MSRNDYDACNHLNASELLARLKSVVKFKGCLYEGFLEMRKYGSKISQPRQKKDHIQEIVDKWRSIDDEIWAKIICMERNRRIAKAYARKHTIIVDGSRDDYLDGATLGLNSFDNPDRDSKTSYLKQRIGEGVKLRIHQNGDIFVKRLSEASVFVHQFKFATSGDGGLASKQLKSSQSSSDVYALNSETGGEFYGVVGPRRRQINTSGPIGRFNKLGGRSKSSSSSQSPTSSSCASSSSSSKLLATSNHMDKPNALQSNRLVRIFNMSRFKEVLEYESRQPTPNRVRLHSMCISIINFVYDDQKMLNLASWIMVINIVAIDLLSSKIGLVGPYDMAVLDPCDPPMSGYRLQTCRFNKLARNKAFEKFSSSNDYDQCNFESAQDERRKRFNAFSGNNNHERVEKSDSNNESQFIMLSNRQPLSERHADSSNSIQYFEGRPALLQETRSEAELKALGSSYNSAEVGSSSSGFDSNCSYQNATPATSSSSMEFAHTQEQAKPLHVKKASKLRRFFKGSEATSKPGESMSSREGSSSSSKASSNGPTSVSSATNIRGKRPPKLPHGISAHTRDRSGSTGNGAAIMSDPIPIPAPPTSAGGSSGKANLILVSPTGLSPPSRAKRANEAHYTVAEPEDLVSRGFANIKHINEDGGRPSLLELGAKQRDKLAKLPTGIPSHAQLAPPATQRHILRYLMSTAMNMGNHQWASNQSDDSLATKKPSNERPPVPPGRAFPRPLPVLPSAHPSSVAQAKAHMQALKAQPYDESLYYSGLQARVPRFQHQKGAGPIHGITKGAIDAILSDFKQTAQFRQQHQQKLNQIRHEQLLLAKIRSNSDAQLRFVSDLVNDQPDQTASNARKLPNHLPNQSYMSLESLNRLGEPNGASGRPSASLLTHMGRFLRRSKTKKSEVPEVK